MYHFFAIFIIITIADTNGFSQTTDLTSTLPALAQEAFDKGIAAARLPDYLMAIRFFEEARKSAPRSPKIFFNLGLAESKIPGRELRAICWFEAYLCANPTAPNATAVNDFIAGLQIKNQGNINLLIKAAQNIVIQINNLNPSYNTVMMDRGLIYCWAATGNYSAAKNIDNRIQDGYWKTDGLNTIALFQADAGDASGAKETLAAALSTINQIQDAGKRNLQMSIIAEFQAIAGDITGALKTAAQIQAASYKCSSQTKIAEKQVKAGDIAGAKETLASALITTDMIQDGSYYKDKSQAQKDIAEVQVKASDIAGAQQTADLIRDTYNKSEAQKAIAEGQAYVKPVIRVIEVSDWLSMLDNDDLTGWRSLPLNTDLFLNLASYLKNLPTSDDPQKAWDPFSSTVQKIVSTQNTIDIMVKQQANQ